MTIEPPAAAALHPRDAARKVRMAEDAWNSRDPARVALAYTPDSRWRNRAEFLTGRAAIEAFPHPQMGRAKRLRLIKEIWAVEGAASPCASPMNGMTRRPMVPVLWQRELAVRRQRPHGRAPRQHQRPCRSPTRSAAVPLACTGAATCGPSRPVGAWSVAAGLAKTPRPPGMWAKAKASGCKVAACLQDFAHRRSSGQRQWLNDGHRAGKSLYVASADGLLASGGGRARHLRA